MIKFVVTGSAKFEQEIELDTESYTTMSNVDHTIDTEQVGVDMSSRSTFLTRLNDKISLLIIVLFSLLCFVPGIYDFSVVDEEESTIVLTSQQMIENNNFLQIHETGYTNNSLKLGTHWLQAIAVLLFGSDFYSSIWVYRLPSLFGVIFALVILFRCVRAFADPQAALLATLLSSATILLAVTSRISNSDALFFLCIVLAHYALAKIWLREETQRIGMYVFYFWLALAACILIDGLLGPMVMIHTIIGLSISNRKFGWILQLKPVLGMLLSLATTVPWIAVANFQIEGGFDIVSIIRDLFGRIGHRPSVKGDLPLTHLVMMLLSFWPLSAFFVIALPSIWRNKSLPKVTFFLAWSVTTWIVLELVVFKPPNLMVSILPAIATLTAVALTSWENDWRFGRWIAAIIVLLLPVLFIALVVGGPIYFEEEIPLLGLLICGAGFLFALISAFRFLQRQNPIRAIVPTLIAVILLNIGFFGLTLPNMTFLRLTEVLSDKIAEVSSCEKPKVGSVDFSEPSLEFYVEQHIDFDSVEEAAAWKGLPGCKAIIVKEQQLDRFQDLVRNFYDRPTEKAVVDGITYSHFEIIEFYIFQ